MLRAASLWLDGASDRMLRERACMANIVRYGLSSYARQEIERRGIPLALLESVLDKPDQVVPERGKLKAYQSRRDIGGKIFLVRAVVDDGVEPAVVVTAYRTTKIGKYWGKL
jgi:hypothetical protein